MDSAELFVSQNHPRMLMVGRYSVLYLFAIIILQSVLLYVDNVLRGVVSNHVSRTTVKCVELNLVFVDVVAPAHPKMCYYCSTVSTLVRGLYDS